MFRGASQTRWPLQWPASSLAVARLADQPRPDAGEGGHACDADISLLLPLCRRRDVFELDQLDCHLQPGRLNSIYIPNTCQPKLVITTAAPPAFTGTQ